MEKKKEKNIENNKRHREREKVPSHVSRDTHAFY
jgi:hypothetical protein